ncbi:Lactose permease [Klebsiella pneumoniae]|nr:Lactose permease [Klebsiella pneumoniae]
MITSNKNYFISCLFFLFFFIGWGCCYPYLSLWLTETIGIKEGANKQVISSQADSLIKISRIWADFFPANTSNQPI